MDNCHSTGDSARESDERIEHIRSTELKELVSRQPSWLVSWGLTIFFVLAVILVAAKWLVNY